MNPNQDREQRRRVAFSAIVCFFVLKVRAKKHLRVNGRSRPNFIWYSTKGTEGANSKRSYIIITVLI